MYDSLQQDDNCNEDKSDLKPSDVTLLKDEPWDRDLGYDELPEDELIFEYPAKLSENADLSFPGTAKPTLTSRNEWQGIAVAIREQVVEIRS
ncbi:hypothetical protein HO133_005752 [Letharia lupina]|uniref:Uncharacterized protein n=1 Tax=Letharia lupina TaxID=560253 RepID=A0A8H6F7U1_9LECA|nr:uncharacterized protein HO133_005752 [Letharia lupina]KAF6218405.1 hypothetical protein HO133_005752 [Letharia lupina]